MDKKAMAEFMRFVNQAAQHLERFPEVNRITLTKPENRYLPENKDYMTYPENPQRRPKLRIRFPKSERPYDKEQYMRELTEREAAEILFDSPEMRRYRAMGK